MYFKNITVLSTIVGGVYGAFTGLNYTRKSNMVFSESVFDATVYNCAGFLFSGMFGAILGSRWFITIPIATLTLYDKKFK